MKKVKYYFKVLLKMDFKELFKTVSKVHKRSGKSRIYIFFDIIKCSIKFLAGYTDYFLFGFEDLTDKERSTYITRGVNNNYLRTLNNSNYYKYFSNKLLFNEKFKKFLGRDYLDLSVASLKKFEEFTKKHKVFMAKPVGLSGGYGILKVVIEDNTNISNLYNELKKDGKTLVEEYIRQHSKMNELCPTSVNTLRIVTIRKNNKTHIMMRVIRIGNGINPVDNFHSGGMYAYFDESGKIINDAMDREGRLFKVHPTTKVPFVGFQIPYYKEAIEMCIEASKVIPEVAFVGFDIAISENGPVIVEGNELPGYDVYQSRIHNKDNRNGLKPYFDKVVYGSEENE